MSETPEGETWLSMSGLWVLDTGVSGGLGEPKTQLGSTSQSSVLDVVEERVSLSDMKSKLLCIWVVCVKKRERGGRNDGVLGAAAVGGQVGAIYGVRSSCREESAGMMPCSFKARNVE